MADLPDSSDNHLPYTLDLPIKPDDPTKSVSGQLFYLIELRDCLDGFWESLRDRVFFPCYEFFELRATEKPLTKELTQQVQTNFDQWLLDYEIVDPWIIRSCLYTLSSWAILALEHGRSYLVNNPLLISPGPSQASLETALAPFAPIFDQPYPLPSEPLSEDEKAVLDRSEPIGKRIYEASVARESSGDFKKRMRRQFEMQLAEYAKTSEALILEQKNLRRDAAWTALYQGRQSPKEIEAWQFERNGESFTHARILQVVNEFADSIGLTLRAPQAGRKAKSSESPA